jgi:hypothetical protein
LCPPHPPPRPPSLSALCSLALHGVAHVLPLLLRDAVEELGEDAQREAAAGVQAALLAPLRLPRDGVRFAGARLAVDKEAGVDACSGVEAQRRAETALDVPGRRPLRRAQRCPVDPELPAPAPRACPPAMQLSTIWAPTAANTSSCPSSGPNTRSKVAESGSRRPPSHSTTTRPPGGQLTQARAAAPPPSCSRAFRGRTRTKTRTLSVLAAGPPSSPGGSSSSRLSARPSSPAGAAAAGTPQRGDAGSLSTPLLPRAPAARPLSERPPTGTGGMPLRPRNDGVRAAPGVPPGPGVTLGCRAT